MAQLYIRDLPDDVHAKLRARAAEAGRSVEAEVREILAAAVAVTPIATAQDLWQLVDRLYGKNPPEQVVDSLIRDRRDEADRE